MQPNPEAVTWLRGRDVAEKLPVFINDRTDNTVAAVLRRLLPKPSAGVSLISCI
jgi:hypothetical protein